MILETLLERLASGRIYTLKELATELDVAPGLVEQMIHDLERGGYLESAQVSCDAACEHCDKNMPCRLVHGGRIWSVTDKGLRAARGDSGGGD
ncbi:MAG: hypothetical protein H5T69_12030 [Chloroflexi bacterium]|nr:hypothetical protein [Chloroflexota bacterium]